MALDFISQWNTLDVKEKEALGELSKLSDRASGIVGALFVENRLTDCLKKRMTGNDELNKKLFQFTGPIGTFSAKIDVGFALGLYSASSHKDLHVLRDIRNDFAHEAFAKGFREQSIRDRCLNLKIVETNVCDIKTKKRPAGSWIVVSNYAKRKGTPKGRYLISCLFFAETLRSITANSDFKMTAAPYF